MTVPNEVRVDYEFVGKHHIFTSKDVKGLFVTSENYEEAVRSLPDLIKLMLEMNHNAIILGSFVPETFRQTPQIKVA